MSATGTQMIWDYCISYNFYNFALARAPSCPGDGPFTLLPYDRRFCVTCPNMNQEIESEVLRQPWILNLQKPDNFEILSLEEKLKVALNEPMNVKHTAKFILDAFSARSKIIF